MSSEKQSALGALLDLVGGLEKLELARIEAMKNGEVKTFVEEGWIRGWRIKVSYEYDPARFLRDSQR